MSYRNTQKLLLGGKLQTIVLVVALFCNISLLVADKPEPISLNDMLEWNSIQPGTAALSGNGAWFSYWYGPENGNARLILQHTSKDITNSWDAGQVPRFRPSADFNTDNSFAAFMVFPTKEEMEKAAKDNRPDNKLTVVNLNSMEETTFDYVKTFAFSEENPDYLAIHLSTPRIKNSDKLAGKGTDLLLLDLRDGKTLSFGNVLSYQFNKRGQWLAWVIDAYDKKANGVQMLNLNTLEVKVLESDQASYSQLSWNEEGNALSAIKAITCDEYEDPMHLALAFKGLDKSIRKIVFDPRYDENLPAGMSISPHRPVIWSEDLASIYFGIHKLTKKKTDDKEQKNEEKPDVVIWHWNDFQLQTQQEVNIARDKTRNDLAVFHIKENDLIRLGNERFSQVDINPGDRFAIGQVVEPYVLQTSLDGISNMDIYLFDIKTGKRSKILTQINAAPTVSPDGNLIYYYSKGDYYVYDLTTEKPVNITESIPSSFINKYSDHNREYPPTRSFGWSSDSRYVLVQDNYDLWKVSTCGSRYENLTQSKDKKNWRIRGHVKLQKDEPGIDLKQPIYFLYIDHKTKGIGIGCVSPNKPGIQTLAGFDDSVILNLSKAKDADVFVYSKETNHIPPSYYVSFSKDLKDPNQITSTCPEQKHFAWSSGARLITYISDQGDTLQAALFLPANYTEGKKYPTVVHIYERLSQSRNFYEKPVLSSAGFNRSMLTSNGYAVLMPDIRYQLNNPGMSAVWCVLPALDAAIESGVVDAENVALQGHSWGGYQTAFLVTQTNRFKAAIAGAALTNMISMYSLIYWDRGYSNQPIFESTQGRFTGGYWDHWEAYTQNSPVYHAQNVNTPLLLMHNDKDGAVDFTQGIEYYNTLRRLRKPVVLLQYKGENHGLNKPVNQFDYTQRMMEYLNHHLKGKEAPDWWSEGVSLLEMDAHLKARPHMQIQ